MSIRLVRAAAFLSAICAGFFIHFRNASASSDPAEAVVDQASEQKERATAMGVVSDPEVDRKPAVLGNATPYPLSRGEQAVARPLREVYSNDRPISPSSEDESYTDELHEPSE